MAYSNWGAWVHRAGEPRHDREDVAVWNDAEADTPAALSIWRNLLRLREAARDERRVHLADAHRTDAELQRRQKQTTTEMTQQNKMMLIFMPVFIGYITITFPAGLGIYWVVSNLVQILQQWFMNRKTTTA